VKPKTKVNIIGWTICLVIGIIFSIGLANASTSGFSKLSISLEEGDTKTITYSTIKEVVFVLEPLYSFEGYQNVILFTPDKLSTTGDITIHLVNLSEQEKGTIGSDNYRFKLSVYDNANLIDYLLIYAYIGEINHSSGTNIDTSILENYLTKVEHKDFKSFVTGQFNLLNVYIAATSENENTGITAEIAMATIENLKVLVGSTFDYQNKRMWEQENNTRTLENKIEDLESTVNVTIAIVIGIFVIVFILVAWKTISRAKPRPATGRIESPLEKIQKNLKIIPPGKELSEEEKKKLDEKKPEVEKPKPPEEERKRD